MCCVPRMPHPALMADVAALTVDRIAGGRFELLARYSDLPDVAAVMSAVELLELKLEGTLAAVAVPRGHAFFHALVASNRVNSSVRRKAGISTEELSHLLKANVIAFHPDETFTFHSRFVERYFKEARGAAAPPTASAAPAADGVSDVAVYRNSPELVKQLEEFKERTATQQSTIDRMNAAWNEEVGTAATLEPRGLGGRSGAPVYLFRPQVLRASEHGAARREQALSLVTAAPPGATPALAPSR